MRGARSRGAKLSGQSRGMIGALGWRVGIIRNTQGNSSGWVLIISASHGRGRGLVMQADCWIAPVKSGRWRTSGRVGGATTRWCAWCVEFRRLM